MARKIKQANINFNEIQFFSSNKDKIKVRLGEWDTAGTNAPYRHQDFGVSEVTINPEFNKKNLRGDLAILTLNKPVALRHSPHIAAACVPPLNAKFAEGQRLPTLNLRFL